MPLYFPAGLVTDGEKMLLLGGYDGFTYTRDIHSLAPGAAWRLEETALASQRGYSAALSVTSGALDC